MREALELKVPPVVVWLVAAAGVWAIDRLFPFASAVLPFQRWIALAVAVAGLTIAIRGVLVFIRHGTTVHPNRPERASAVVTGDVFSLTRNPMYLGLGLVLFAWTLELGSPLGALLFVPAFVIYLTEFQIKPEERALRANFGSDYERYLNSVRRWL